MRHLKRIIFTLLGFVFVAGPVMGIIYALTGADKFEATIGNIIGLTFISILLAFLMCLIGALIGYSLEQIDLPVYL